MHPMSLRTPAPIHACPRAPHVPVHRCPYAPCPCAPPVPVHPSPCTPVPLHPPSPCTPILVHPSPRTPAAPRSVSPCRSPMASPSVRLWIPSPSTTIHTRSVALGLGGSAGLWECPWECPRGGPWGLGSSSGSGAVRHRSSAPAVGEARGRCGGRGHRCCGGRGGVLTATRRGQDPGGCVGGLSGGVSLGEEQRCRE